MKKQIKKPKFEDLPEAERKLILKLVRRYVTITGMASTLGLGLEHCEEIVIGMLQDDTLKIVLTKDLKTYTIEPNEAKWSRK